MNLIRRSSALVALTVSLSAAGLLAASAAFAHVTVSSPDAVQGGYSVLTFRVPTESDTASTTEFKLQLPTDQPLASVSVLPTPGWSFTVSKAKLASPITTDDGPVTEAISVIDWKADTAGTAVKPGEFQQFLLSVGPLPKADSMTFKAIQSYSDRSVVSWIEQAAPGSTAEPEHPAPTLKLAAPSGSSTGPAQSTTSTATATSPSSGGTSSDATATTALVLGIVGILLGGLALALVLLRGRRTAA